MNLCNKAFLLFGLTLILCGPLQAQSPIAARQQAAEMALTEGNAVQAAALARDMLRDDPDSYVAAILLALALSDLNEHRAAAETAVLAYQAALTRDDRRQAAQLAGKAWSDAGSFWRSEVWLRRAANNIASEAEARSIAAALQEVRQANPVQLQFNATITPSDNINDGAENPFFQLEGLPFDFLLPPERQALSGVSYSAEGRLDYRLWSSAQLHLSAGGYLFGESHILSAEAQDTAPDVRGSDFSTVIAELSMGLGTPALTDLGPTSLRFGIGQIWQGGDPSWRYASLIGQQTLLRSPTGLMTLQGSYTRQTPAADTQPAISMSELSVTQTSQRANGDVFRLAAHGVAYDGGFENIYSEWRLTAGYAHARPFMGALWRWDAELSGRHYDTFTTTLTGRDDRASAVQAKLVFADLSYWGFSPQMTLRGSSRTSTAEEFTARTAEISFGIESQF